MYIYMSQRMLHDEGGLIFNWLRVTSKKSSVPSIWLFEIVPQVSELDEQIKKVNLINWPPLYSAQIKITLPSEDTKTL